MFKITQSGKIVIVGAGNVGSTIAYSILMNNLASEIVMIDVNREKAEGETLDMNHGLAYLKQVTVRAGEYHDCEDANIVIITAGIARKPGQTRLELAKINVGIVRDIMTNVLKYNPNPLILMVSNPVDITTYIAQKEFGLPATRVIGSGTTLDTARFRYLLSQHCRIDVRNVHAYIIGEHGDSSLPVWSRANIGGKPFDVYCDNCDKNCGHINRDKIFEEAKISGADIIRLKGATFYGIGMAVAKMVSCIVGNENSVLTVSLAIEGTYGINDVALSLPCVVGAKGIDRILDIDLDDQEVELLKKSADTLKTTIKEIYE